MSPDANKYGTRKKVRNVESLKKEALLFSWSATARTKRGSIRHQPAAVDARHHHNFFDNDLLWWSNFGSFQRFVNSLKIEDYEDNRHAENEEQAQEDNQCSIHSISSL